MQNEDHVRVVHKEAKRSKAQEVIQQYVPKSLIMLDLYLSTHTLLYIQSLMAR